MKIFDNGHIYGFFILHLQKTLARYDFEFWAWPVDWRMGENGYVVFKRNLVCLYACHKSLRILVSYCMAIQRKTLTLNMTYCECTGIYSWQVVYYMSFSLPHCCYNSVILPIFSSVKKNWKGYIHTLWQQHVHVPYTDAH